MSKVKLYDFIQVKSGKEVEELSAEQKVRLEDFLAGSPSNPGIKVTFDLSAAGKVINSRIYPPYGQQSNVDSWTNPFQKPILKEHRKNDEPIGRFQSVQYVSLEKEAIAHLGDVRKYLEVKKAFDSKKASVIYDVMTKYNLLRDKKWPGLGKLVATAKISDPDAVTKFLDERYLTFSAGAETDSYVCMICEADWFTGEMCEHRPGKTDDEGRPVVFLTGNYFGDEASVVNNPANKSSIVRSIEFEAETMKDFNESDYTLADREEDGSFFVIADSEVELPDTRKLLVEFFMNLEDSTIPSLIGTESLKVDELIDAITGATLMEKNWIVSLHNSLHESYDYRLDNEYSLEGADTIPKEVFKVHDQLMKTAESLGIRDALKNGSLDSYDSMGEEIESVEMAEDSEKNAETTVEVADTKVPESQVQDTKIEEPVIEEDIEIVVDDEIDWFTLDLALESLVTEDAKLSTEKRESLPASAFCGPERSFPVNDCAHYTAALRLLSRYKGPGNKDKIRSCIEAKGKKLGCVEKTTDSNCQCKKVHDQLKADYTEALRQIDALETSIKQAIADKIKDDIDYVIDDSKSALETLEGLLNKIFDQEDKKTGQKEKQSLKIKEVISPALETSSEVTNSTLDKLDTFQQNIVNRYRKILTDSNKEAADRWLVKQRSYLPRGFDPNKYI